MPKPVNVLFLAAEADPYVKVGGLGDVAGSLPRALRQVSPNLDVRVALPFHKAIRREGLKIESVADFTIMRDGRHVQVQVYQTRQGRTPVYLIDGVPIRAADSVYSSDMVVDGEKYAFFSMAAVEMLEHMQWYPHILHANDWHAAPAVYILRQRRGSPDAASIKSVLSIHNLPFMGGGSGPALSAYGIHPALASGLPDWSRHFPLPMGLWAADSIVAVSPAYAREMLTPEFGCGLQDFLRTRADVLSGILNGIDTDLWNPETDSALAVSYNAKSLAARAGNKVALQTTLGLPVDPTVPLLAMISRMDPQKGVDIAVDGLRLAADRPWQAVILGTGIGYLEDRVRGLQIDFPDTLRAEIRFDAHLSHLIYAGADMLLMPSRYEPCGLAQMIAMRYGCVPLARATGGLVDTIQPHTDAKNGTGFLFEEATPEAFASALHTALVVFGDRRRWQALQRSGMAMDFSWEKSAGQYYVLYKSLLAAR
jgi:starch synthase